MNNQRSGFGQNQNKQKNPLNPRRNSPGQSQGIRPPNPNKNRRPPRKGDNKFLNNRTRAPQGPQNIGQSQGPNMGRSIQTFEKVFRRYEYLQEQHCIARRKYFENYYKSEGAQRERSEKSFYNSLEQLRDYVSTLSPEQKEAFEKKYNGSPLDLTYSQTRNLPAQSERVKFSDKFEDPHVLKSQKETDYSSDTEESIGTLEDYQKYKGLA